MSMVKPPLDEALLEHFGVKGMKWGVRKERTSAEKKALAKKVALGVGTLLVVAGAAIAVQQLRKKGNVSIASAPRKVAEGKKIAAKILSEPIDVIHGTRGKNKGFTFLKKGGVPTFLEEYETMFGVDSSESNIFKRQGGKIGASFLDPDGKKDFAGRVIPHQIIIPKSMTQGINSLDDVKSKIWPLLKDQYESYYHTPK